MRDVFSLQEQLAKKIASTAMASYEESDGAES
jgi:hypothetical protein